MRRRKGELTAYRPQGAYKETMMSARPRVRHELKTWPEFFQPTLNGIKRFELRRDDRPDGFQVGDELLLKEWDPTTETIWSPVLNGPIADPGPGVPCEIPKGYTGREVLVRVDYVMPADTVRQIIHPLLEPDEMDEFVIMSVSLVN